MQARRVRASVARQRRSEGALLCRERVFKDAGQRAVSHARAQVTHVQLEARPLFDDLWETIDRNTPGGPEGSADCGF